MSDLARQLILVGSVVAVAAAAAGAAFLRQRLRSGDRHAPLDLSTVEGRVLLFSEASCRSCEAARGVLEASGAGYREVRYEDEPAVHRTAGVTMVPLIVVRSPDGGVVGRIVGKPSSRRFERLLRDAGIK